MKKTIYSAFLATAVAFGAWIGFSSSHDDELTPAQIANLEALTDAEGYVKYDKNCAAGGPNMCVPNWYTIIYDQYVYND